MKIFVVLVFLLALSVFASDHFLKPEMENGKNILTTEKAKIGGGDVFNVSVASEDLKQTQNLKVAVLGKGGSKTVLAEIFEPFSAENPELEAKGVYVFDLLDKKEVFSKNLGERFPLASLTKLMTAVVALENMADDVVITISEEAIKQEGDIGFTMGEKWFLFDLIDIMLVSSSNDAAFSVFEETEKSLKENDGAEFVDLMNAKAKELQMNDTIFYNTTGLDISKTKAGAYGSLKDTALLTEYILVNYPEIFLKTKEKLITLDPLKGSPKIFYNTNTLLGKISGIEGAKTGFTELSGGNLVLVWNSGENHSYLIVILGSSLNGRFADAEKIVKMIEDKLI